MLINDWLRFLKQGRFGSRGQFGTRSRRASRRTRRTRRGDWSDTAQALESRILLSAVNDPPIASPVFINVLEDSGTQLIQLLGADGDVEFDQQLTYALTGTPAHGTLSDFNPVAGTVLYTPDPNYQGPDSFTYTVSDDGGTVLSLMGTVSGTISTPGTEDTYSFTLPVDSQLYFDSLTGSNTLSWTLTGPAGEITRNFDNSDTFNSILNLPAGDYSLKIDGAYDTTGTYQFRLINLASASALPIGSMVNGSLNPVNETDLYKFNAVAGNRFQFDAFPISGDIGNSWWRLMDPYGNELAGNYLNGGDFGPITLTNSGTFTLLIEGHSYETGVSGGYSFLVSQLPDDPIPPVVGTPLSLGVVTSGSIVVPDETIIYTFNLPAKAQLYFDSLTTTDSAIIWELTGPAGTINNDFLQADVINGSPVMSLVAGDYALTISRDYSGTGPYEFRLLDLAAATPIVPGTPVSGTLAPTNETELYRFSGIAGEKFYFDADPISGDIVSSGWRLIDPYGNVVANNFLNGGDLGPITLPNSGTFTVLIEGNPYETGTSGDYTLNVVPVMTNSAVMTLGSTVAGTLATPGSFDTYNFTLPTASQLYFDALSGDSYLSWTLTGPAGEITQSFPGSDYLNTLPVLNLPAGNYTLQIDRYGDSTGPYQFRLIDIASASSLPIGSLVNGTLNPVNETDFYQFNAVAGNRFLFDALPITGDIPNASWRLIDPYGNVLSGNILNDGDFGPITLTNSGTFTLLIEGYVDEIGVSGGYSFLVSQLPDDPIPPVIGTPLSLGSLTSGSIDVADETKTYTFNLPAKALLYFDSLTSTDSAITWVLTGPAGTIYNDFVASDLGSSSPVMNLVAGDYALTISRSDSGTGPYEFRLLDLAAATPIVPETPVTGTLASTNETDLYKFSGMAGEKFYFDVDPITGDIFNAYWRLIDPYGNVLAGNFLNGGDIGPVSLPNSGTFTLLIEGHPFEGGTSGDYAFNVIPVMNAPAPLTSNPSTSSVSVISVNDAPGGADATLVTPEDIDLTFAPGDFGFTDPIDSPANTLLAVKITTLPAAGTLKFNGSPVTAGDFIPVAGITGGQLKFTPATNVFGSPYASFTFQVQDNGGISNGGVDLDQSPNTITINVTSVNDAPAGTDSTVWIYEEGEHVFTTANFGFTDPNDSPANTLLAVKITTLPAAGTVTLNGTPVTAGQFISVASITAGQLKYLAAPNLSNASYGVTFQVQDNGGIANGGVDLDPILNLVTINVLQVNDAPQGANATLAIDKNTEHVFTTANFGFTDTNDSPANTLLAVKITTLPAVGTLTLNGNPVSAGDFIPVADITGGQFKFTPAMNGFGSPYSSFTFQVQDNGGIANGGVDLDQSPKTITFNVQQVYFVSTGPEFLVNTWTSGNQFRPSTAMDAVGNFVVAWASSQEEEAGAFNIFAQRFNSAGVPQGGEFLVNTWMTGYQDDPSVAMDADGDFVITWLSDGQDGSGYGIYAQRYNAAGLPQGGEFRVNTSTASNQKWHSVAMDSAGNFVVSWSSQGQDGSGYGVYAQRYDSVGAALGGEFLVNTWTSSSQNAPSVAMDADGDFVITWMSGGGQDGSDSGIYAQRYNTAGLPLGGEFRVNSWTTGLLIDPEIGMDADGDFVITWTSASSNIGQDGSLDGVYAQRYNSLGVPQGDEFRVNSYTSLWQNEPSIAMDAAGNFVVTWHSVLQDGSQFGIYAQRYDSSGSPQGGEFRVNSWTSYSQDSPSVAMDSAGNFVIAWNSNVQDGYGEGIFAQRFIVPNQPPTGINLSNSSVAENLPVGTPVGLFSTIDPDVGNTFTYTLVPGTGASGNASFTIVGNELRTAAVFDYESVSSYSIRVRTTDQGGEWFEQVFTIQVTDVIETVVNHAPVLNNAGTPTLDPLIQNQSLATNNGTLLRELILRMEPAGGITDADLDPIGIAINGVSNTYGSWQYTVNSGTNWTPITVTGNNNALLLAADSNTRIRFLPNANFIGNTRLAFVAWDRNSGANGGTANVASRGGTTPYSIAYEYASINVVNVAPVLDAAGSPTLDTIATNVYNDYNPGTLVSDIIARMAPNGGITDANPGALQGIAINGLLNTDKGSWQFTTNGGTSWISIGTTGNSDARLLAADTNTRIRFVPIAGFAGTASFAFVAWDRTSGYNGAVTGAGTRGGSTPYSLTYDYASISVVNAAPVLNDAGNPLFDGLLPDTPAASNPGTLVSTLIARMYPAGGITDANPGALRGIAIIGKTATANGTWEFSTNNGATWQAINATGGANALLLASDANTRVRYRPNPGFRGEAKIAFTAWDQMTGSNGATVNASTRGGTTAFSLAYEYASLFVNTAPTLDASGTPTLDPIPNTITDLANVGTQVNTILNRMAPGGITDPDPGALRGMAIVGLTGTANGTWQYTINNGTSWSNILTTGSANALLLSNNANTKIRFVPNSAFVGTASIAFVAWDQTQYLNGSIVNAGLRGGPTPFSTLYDYASITVSS